MYTNKGYTEKPKEHISIIKPRLQGANTIKDIDLETLIKYIQRGYSISPAVMDGKGCKAENWKEQRLFMVDIDNDKYFYVDSERKLIISVEEYNVSKEKWKCELGFIGKNERIKKVRKNTEEKSIDMNMGENEGWRINMKKENGIKRKKKKEEEEEIKKKQKEEEEKKGGVLTYIAKALALNSFTDY